MTDILLKDQKCFFCNKKAIHFNTYFLCSCCNHAYQIGQENMWQIADPRHTIWKRAHIIILRPNGQIGTGFVDSKETYSISTSFEDYRYIEEWDINWLWCRSPNQKW